MNDPYQTLGVSRNASKDEIKKAYKKLAMKHHPDKGGDATKFKEITNAYTTLTEDKQPETLFQGDEFMGANFFSSFFGGGGGGNPFFGHFGPRPHGGQQGPPPPMNKRVVKTILISMQDAYKGVVKNVKVEVDDNCDDCVQTCKECHGKGVVIVQRKIQMGHNIMVQSSTVNCSKCTNGKTTVKNNTCNKCKGETKVKYMKIVTLNIDPGCQTSKTFTFPDIIPRHTFEFVIQVQQMPNYIINNNHLIYKHSIKLTDALCGTTIIIEHPSGEPVIVDTKTLPNIVYEGYEHVIPKKGMTPNHGLTIVFHIINPKSKKESKEINTSELRDLLDQYLTF